METLHSSITTIVSRFDAVDRHMEILDHRMDAIDRHYQTLDTRQATMDQSNLIVLQSMDQLTGWVSEMQAAQGQIQTEIVEINTHVSSIEQSITYSCRRRVDPSPAAPSTSVDAPPPPPSS